MLNRDGGIINEALRFSISALAHHQSQASFANVPQRVDLVGLGKLYHLATIALLGKVRL